MNGYGQGLNYGKRQPKRATRKGETWAEAGVRTLTGLVAAERARLEAAEAGGFAAKAEVCRRMLAQYEGQLERAQAELDIEKAVELAPLWGSDYPDAEPGQIVDIAA